MNRDKNPAFWRWIISRWPSTDCPILIPTNHVPVWLARVNLIYVIANRTCCEYPRLVFHVKLPPHQICKPEAASWACDRPCNSRWGDLYSKLLLFGFLSFSVWQQRVFCKTDTWLESIFEILVVLFLYSKEQKTCFLKWLAIFFHFHPKSFRRKHIQAACINSGCRMLWRASIVFQRR